MALFRIPIAINESKNIHSINALFDAMKVNEPNNELNKLKRRELFKNHFEGIKDVELFNHKGSFDKAGDFTVNTVPIRIRIHPVLIVIIDSIYCLTEILKAYKIYGDNYVSSFPTAAAKAHKKLAFWCRLLLLLKECLKDTDNPDWDAKGTEIIEGYEQDLRDLLGYDDLYYIYQGYHYEKTIECYDRAISTHTNGRAYAQFIEKMYYLDDDFNDDTVHFNIALERYQINTGAVHEQMNKLIDNHVEQNYLYRYDTYIDTSSDNAT